MRNFELFKPFTLVTYTPSGEPAGLYRYICTDEGGDLHLLEVTKGTTPTNTRFPQIWSDEFTQRGLADGVIRRVTDTIRHREMDNPLAMLSVDELSQLDKEGRTPSDRVDERHEWVEMLLGGDCARYLADPAFRVAQLNKVSRLTGKTKNRLQQVLTRYFWYGGGKGALYPVNWLKGGRGRSRRSTNVRKVGRPNANVVLDSATIYRGANLSADMHSEWTVLVKENYPRVGKISLVFDDLMSPKLAAIPVHLRPERRLFLEEGWKAVQTYNLKSARAGHIDWLQRHAARTGSATDLCRDVIDIYDLDGTPFNCYLKFGGVRREGIGKPTVILAISRRTRCVVGWYVVLEDESGKTYKHCLFSAFTPKSRVIERLGIQEKLRGLVHGTCDQVFFDRGPGISRAVTEAVVRELNLDLPMAEPGRGDLKGTVEGVLGLFQRWLSTLPGAFERTGDRVDKEKQDKAEDTAAVTLEEFERCLVKAINEYNLTADVTKVVTVEMTEDSKIELTPAGLFNWYKKRRFGGAAKDWTEAEIYFSLLETRTPTVRRGLVRADGGHYTSTELAMAFNKHRQRLRTPEPMKINIRIPLDDGSYVLWEQEDGSFSELRETGQTRRRFGCAMRAGRKFINLWIRAKRRVDVSRGLLSVEKQKATDEATARRKQATVSVGTTKDARNEKAAAEKTRRAREGRERLGLPVEPAKLVNPAPLVGMDVEGPPKTRSSPFNPILQQLKAVGLAHPKP